MGLSVYFPEEPKASINFGKIEGGTSVNTIAPEAFVLLDIRSENFDVLNNLTNLIVGLVQEFNSADIEVTTEHIGDRPAGSISIDHPLCILAGKAILEQGDEPIFTIGSTDANIPLSKGLPAVTIGLTTGGGVHTIQEYIDIAPIKKGMDQLFYIIKNIWSVI